MASSLYKPDQSDDPSVKKVIRSKKSGAPIFIEIDQSFFKSTMSLSPKERFYSFFESTKKLTHIKNPNENLLVEEVVTDELGMTHVRARQQYKGVNIYGADLILHLGQQSEIFTGRISQIGSNLEVRASIDSKTAIDFAIKDLQHNSAWLELSSKQQELLNYESPQSELLIYTPAGGTARLSYEVNIRSNFIESWKYFIDARDGTIIYKYNNTKSDGPATANANDLQNNLQTINTFLSEGRYYMMNATEDMFNPDNGEGIIRTFEDIPNSSEFNLVNSMDNTWNNPAAVSLHVGSAKTYDYFKNTFGRNSINGKGGTITGVVNMLEEDGSGMDNAFWSAPIIYFGSGKAAFSNLAGGLDVIAHELGHGVVENTANLEYQGQSGAINETYADIFGAMVDREDWLIGEDVSQPAYFPSGTMRDMSDPHNQGMQSDHYWQPNHVSEMYIGDEDRGGVHINSGIGNHAYYLFATALSKEKAEQVFYRALANYLSTKSQFIDFRIAVIQSAKDLYGESSVEADEAAKAFDAVGIFEEEQIDYEQEYLPNDGQDYILSYDTDSQNDNTLYRSTTAGDDFYALTTTIMKGKVSVVDDGSLAVFVSDDSRIRSINTDPADPDEFIVSDQEFWDNVAISKDGNRLACISTEVDTAIYVYDFESSMWAKYQLYNPTTSHSGTDAGGVMYADAIVFDHTGEYLMYDAFNSLSTTFGESLSYWDIGFIKVWDNEGNQFGDGSIEKLYGSLPEDVSIGNPVFSNNSPNIIAFDYWDAYTDEYAILGADLLSGDLDVIYTNTRLGFPSFSTLDDEISFTAHTTDEEDVIGVIGLEANKISSMGDASALIGDAIWSVYYATGTRSLSLAPVANFSVDAKSGEAPLAVQFLDLSINNPTSWSWVFEGGSPSSSSLQNPSITYNNIGTYEVSLTATNASGSNTLSKTSYIHIGATDTDQEKIETLVSYYPNPVSGILNIDCQKEFTVRIYNMLGRKLIDANNQNQLDLASFSPGMYVLQIEIEGELVYGKIQKN